MVCQAFSFLFFNSIKISLKLWFWIIQEEKIGECVRWMSYMYNIDIDIIYTYTVYTKEIFIK